MASRKIKSYEEDSQKNDAAAVPAESRSFLIDTLLVISFPPKYFSPSFEKLCLLVTLILVDGDLGSPPIKPFINSQKVWFSTFLCIKALSNVSAGHGRSLYLWCQNLTLDVKFWQPMFNSDFQCWILTSKPQMFTPNIKF